MDETGTRDARRSRGGPLIVLGEVTALRWWEVRVRVPQVAAEAVSAVLQEWPEVHGVAMEGVFTGGVPHPEYGEWFTDEVARAESVEVSVYLPETLAEAQVHVRLADARARLEEAGFAVPGFTEEAVVRLVDESEWESAWKEHFHPLPVGQRLIIVPKWEDDRPDSSRIPIVMEPGMAFGTGTHATTQLCLEAIEQLLRPQDEVADVGCGTAVLAIAAAKLGARRVLAIDIDPVAVRVARDNVADNQVQTRVAVMQGDLLEAVPGEPTFDLVVANILRDAVIAVAPAAWARLRPGGRFIASGFVTSQTEMVRQALLQTGYTLTHMWEREDWVALAGEKPR